jgi:hypothetical protein
LPFYAEYGRHFGKQEFLEDVRRQGYATSCAARASVLLRSGRRARRLEELLKNSGLSAQSLGLEQIRCRG